MEVCCLASGSRGNSYYVSAGDTEILVDNGLSLAEIEHRLAAVGKNPKNIKAIFLTHEHTDHISGVVAFCLKYNAQFFVHKSARFAVQFMASKIMDKIQLFDCNDFYFGAFTVSPFETSHDSAYPVGFSFYCAGKKVTIMTDTGYVTQEAALAASQSNLVVLESNHDVDMLLFGPYPAKLKRRIIGREGHLSNVAAANFAVDLAKSGAQTIVLAHLSEKNNTEQKALDAVCGALKGNGLSLRIAVAKQNKPTEIFEV